MGDKTAHFDFREFSCTCGCGTNRTKDELIFKMEDVYTYLDKTPDGVSAILINSGYRCSKFSQILQGAFLGDTHNLGFGCDFHAIKADGVTKWSSYELAAVCEKLGFNGIGIITNHDVHGDLRTDENYKNGHALWNEINGDNDIKSFLSYLPKQVQTTEKQNIHIKLMIDGISVIDTDVPFKK